MKPLTSKKKSMRPTTGKVREALFNILRGKIENARFLDLYAGTGAVGINALKEGASEVVFVEENRRYSKEINELIKRYNFSDRATVITKKALSYIEQAELNQLAFDIIFLDPPYHTDEILLALTAIGRSDILRTGGIAVAEHFAKRQLPDTVERLKKIRDYSYGDSVLSLYEAC